jgi:hypothetical protein
VIARFSWHISAGKHGIYKLRNTLWQTEGFESGLANDHIYVTCAWSDVILSWGMAKKQRSEQVADVFDQAGVYQS